MFEIPAVASTQFGAYTGQQAASEGMGRAIMRHALASGRAIRLRRGVFGVPSCLPVGSHARLRDENNALCAAALLAESASTASHRSSALFAGLPVLTYPDQPCLTIAPGRHGSIPGVHLHRATLHRPGDVVKAGSLSRTSTVRTVIDTARESGVAEAVVVADAALRRGMITAEQLTSALERYRHWPGAPRAALAIAACDGRAESPLESVSRLGLARTDIPRPQTQVEIFTRDGRWIARSDFGWDEYGVLGEADGMEKYDDDPNALRREKKRQERLEELGLIVVRWGWADVRQPTSWLARLKRALIRGRARLQADPGIRNWFACPADCGPSGQFVHRAAAAEIA